MRSLARSLERVRCLRCFAERFVFNSSMYRTAQYGTLSYPVVPKLYIRFCLLLSLNKAGVGGEEKEEENDSRRAG